MCKVEKNDNILQCSYDSVSKLLIHGQYCYIYTLYPTLTPNHFEEIFWHHVISTISISVGISKDRHSFLFLLSFLFNTTVILLSCLVGVKAAHTCSAKEKQHMPLFPLRDPWLHERGLKLTMKGVYTPWKSTHTNIRAFISRAMVFTFYPAELLFLGHWNSS